MLAFMLVLFGSVWLCWLWLLHPSSIPSSSQAAASNPSSVKLSIVQPPLRCHQVAPMMRSTLFVFTVMLSLSTIAVIARHLFATDRHVTLSGWIRRLWPLCVLLALFAIQLLYLLHVRKNRAFVVPVRGEDESGCSSSPFGWRWVQKWTLILFAIVQIGVGIGLVFRA